MSSVPSPVGVFTAHARSILALASILFAPACDGCQGSKPYTPYTLSDPPAGSGSAHAGPANGDPARLADGGFAAVAASAAPGDGKSWALEGGAAEPPVGHAFAEGLVIDADGDGTPDLLAWAKAPDGLRGEIWFASGKAPASGRTVATLPGDLASAGCAPSASLTRINPTAVLFDFEARCDARRRERSGRWLALLRISQNGAPPEIGLELRLGAPADGESIAIAIDGRDRDGDGRGDVTAAITLSGAPRPLAAGGSASATIAFLDRPAGFSRDPSEPEASLKALAAGLVSDGRKRSTASHVAATATSARRLHALICEEAGKPVLTTSAGLVRCGDVHLIEDATVAEAEAAINLGDPIAAIAARDRLSTRRKDVDGLIGKAIPSIPGRLMRTTAAVPDLQPAPAFGPVAFDAKGDLFVRTRGRVVRVDRTSFDEAPVDGAGSWPTRLAWPATGAPSWTLTSVEARCDAPALVARFDIGGAPTDVPLPILTPPRCTASTSVHVDLLGAGAQGELVAIDGTVVAIPREAAPHPVLAEALATAPSAAFEVGAGRSPNGTAIAIGTARGVLVATLKGQGRAASATLWTTPALDDATACVPSDGAERIACAVKNAVAIYDAK